MKTIKFGSSSLALILMLAACGPQAYVPGTNHLTQGAGSMNLPPKIDIIVGVDMKGAMKDIYPGMSAEFDAFSANLQNSGWNYRLTAISLSEGDPMPLNKIAVSKYDSNWNALGQWLQPYPGALPTLTQPYAVSSSYFAQSTTAASFFPSTISSYGNDGHKTGIANQVNFATRWDVINQFIRSDAMLAIITLSDSRDTSGGSWQTNQYGQTIWNAPSPDNLGTYVNQLASLKGSASLLKYYALVSHYQHAGTCRGAYTFAGTRYESMAAALGGTSIDICTNTLPTALSQVQNNLNIAKLAFRKVYLVLGTEPNVGTIRIQKNGVDVPQDANNGWEYVGYLNNQATIDQPVAMDAASGYMIRLNGTARLTGSDSATIDYMNAGAVSSH